MISWRNLNNQLATLSEQQVFALLEEERRVGRRVSVLARLHQRFTTLRAARERAEILKEASKR